MNTKTQAIQKTKNKSWGQKTKRQQKELRQSANQKQSANQWKPQWTKTRNIPWRDIMRHWRRYCWRAQGDVTGKQGGRWNEVTKAWTKTTYTDTLTRGPGGVRKEKDRWGKDWNNTQGGTEKRNVTHEGTISKLNRKHKNNKTLNHDTWRHMASLTWIVF